MVACRARRSTGAFKDLEAGFEDANPNVTCELEFFDYDTYIQTLQTSLPSGSGA